MTDHRVNPLRAEIQLDPELIEAIADAVAARIAVLPSGAESPWLSGAQAAADYLGWPKARIHRWIRELPHYRAGGRLMFRREELDAWVTAQREGSQDVPPESAGGGRLLRDAGIGPLGAFQNRSTPAKEG